MRSLGPVSMFAIKNGRMDDAEDTGYFVRSISEPIYHQLATFGQHSAIQRLWNPSRCASLIVTKEAEKVDRPDTALDVCSGMVRDITEMYKELPRLDMVHGIRVIDFNSGQEIKTRQEVEFSFVLNDKTCNTMVGDDFVVTIEIANTNEMDSRRVSANLIVYSVNQYGEDRKLVSFTPLWSDHVLSPWEEDEECVAGRYVPVTWQEYNDSLKPGNHLQLVLIGNSKIGNYDMPQHIVIMEDVHLKVPTIDIVLEEDQFYTSEQLLKSQVRELTVDQPTPLTLEFTNPLPVEITDWSLAVEGAGVKPHRVDKPKNFPIVGPGQKFRAEFSITPTRATPDTVGTLIVTFHHPFLGGAFGSRRLTVLPPPEAKID